MVMGTNIYLPNVHIERLLLLAGSRGEIHLSLDSNQRRPPTPLPRHISRYPQYFYGRLGLERLERLKAGATSKVCQLSASLDTRHRLLLTGTPLQNTVGGWVGSAECRSFVLAWVALWIAIVLFYYSMFSPRLSFFIVLGLVASSSL